ncbi:MAG: ABC transporter permease [Candidatus Eiseniibacteriota bacterium]|nr:MAG: ABC transporter permease [Candidatus Eisenbacteria bacterium]
MRTSRSRILSIAHKEFFHILRDFRTLIIVFLMPVVQLIMFGYALNLEIQRVDAAVIDFSRSTASRDLVERFEGSRFFRPFYFEGGVSQVGDLFKSRAARVALIIPSDFERQLLHASPVSLQVLIDASDSNAATLIRNYCNQVLVDYNASRGAQLPVPFDVRTAVLFNPNLKSSYFFVPGVIAMILVMISALLTSIAIAREKETGTMEQMLVSPVLPHEIILGKVLPYIALAFADAAVILFVGLLVFRVPFVGSAVLLVLLTTLYIITALSLGLMISTRVRTQQVAMMLALTVTLLPTILLSGLVFPIASMPAALQYVTYLVPARYYLLIVRGILLKGSLLGQLAAPALSLVAMSLVLLVVSVRRFSMNLER